ncbi:hypothetical protein SeLEV6574_g01014 [Synchytrium endobioticum]|uniref:5'-3' exoribonuclease n=1 Tax=Synchytrium endobioticum TaxID=286115 RepID=A0A507DF04_9FUNG|nr:hypothetical protein SeLEV6574_g01014 [Synchytrium endobioticum]
MGVPALFRWLTKKYPKITTQVVEEKNIHVDGFHLDIDIGKPNPNGFEIDNLYLDMNGIVHPCCHPENRPPPPTEDAMFAEMFKYLDRIMAMVRPRKLVYMAIDGVAPRAKMNQQRSRRFRAAADAEAKEESEKEVRRQYEEEHGVKLDTKKESFDSNCITPGTPFMNRLAECLRYYIAKKLNEDPGWAKLKFVISDASVPGEGEHKIMDYIRSQRALRDHDPNTTHVLHGLDADLIMLALATHEPHFKILREDVFYQEGSKRGCFICGQTDHQASECTGQAKPKIGEFGEKDSGILEKPHIFLHLNVLREYLESELQLFDISFPFSFERAIDDWIFLIFFVGNDFLPHIPSLEIREDAIDRLVDLWKRAMPELGGWLTDSGSIDLRRVEVIMRGLGDVEDDIFRKRRAAEERRRESSKRRKEQQRNRQHQQGNPRWKSANGNHSRFNKDDEVPEIINAAVASEVYAHPNQEPPQNTNTKEDEVKSLRDRLKALEAEKAQAAAKDAKTTAANKAAADALRGSLKASSLKNPDDPGNIVEQEKSDGTVHRGTKRKVDELDKEDEELDRGTISTGPAADEVPTIEGERADEEEEEDPVVVEATVVTDIPTTVLKKVVGDDEEPVDNVRLWEAGWKQRYYRSKFGVEPDNQAFRQTIANKYVEGLCWVLAYYYQGVPSWKWFYPYYYSPFASDFGGIGDLDIKFELGEPFKPFEQLMAVFPARSRQHIPSAFHQLMTDPDSPIYDFYPIRFDVDMDGKKYAWQGVAKLPWIDENRLLEAMSPVYPLLTSEEVSRNQFGYDILYFGCSHELFESLCRLYGKKAVTEPMQLDPKLSQNMHGTVLPDPDLCPPGTKFPSQLTSQNLKDIDDVQSLSAFYLMPKFPAGHVFRAELKRGVEFPQKVLTNDDTMWLRSKSGGHRRGPANTHVAQRMIAHSMPGSYGTGRPSQQEHHNGYGGTGPGPYGHPAYVGNQQQYGHYSTPPGPANTHVAQRMIAHPFPGSYGTGHPNPQEYHNGYSGTEPGPYGHPAYVGNQQQYGHYSTPPGPANPHVAQGMTAHPFPGSYGTGHPTPQEYHNGYGGTGPGSYGHPAYVGHQQQYGHYSAASR